MTRPIVAASFLAGITAAGLAGRTFARRWFTAARQVEQAPLEPYLPHPAVTNPYGFGESAARMALADDAGEAHDPWLGVQRAYWGPSAADHAMPEVGE